MPEPEAEATPDVAPEEGATPVELEPAEDAMAVADTVCMVTDREKEAAAKEFEANKAYETKLTDYIKTNCVNPVTNDQKQYCEDAWEKFYKVKDSNRLLKLTMAGKCPTQYDQCEYLRELFKKYEGTPGMATDPGMVKYHCEVKPDPGMCLIATKSLEYFEKVSQDLKCDQVAY